MPDQAVAVCFLEGSEVGESKDQVVENPLPFR